MLSCMPLACATKMDAADKYKVVPSKLKLMPVGKTKLTNFRGTPYASKLCIAGASAASLLAVPNAMDTGIFTAL